LHFIRPKTTNFNFNILTYLGSTLLHLTIDDELFLKKENICHISSNFGKGKMYLLFMEFHKCVRVCVKTYWGFFGSNPNEMSIAFFLMETPHDELFIFYITFAYVYNKLFTFISLHNN
jgi:hypothetical protein